MTLGNVARIVAFGGGHGLAATLRALAALPIDITAVVGTGDDGGSSGRLREHLGVPPPGDLRMAIVAMSERESPLWARVMQHRFGGRGDVEGHALGNLLLAALWEETGDVVAGLDLLAGVLRARGRVLPNTLQPVVLVADVVDVEGRGRSREVRGQARVTTTRGTVTSLRIEPEEPLECPEALDAIGSADALVFGPGSWYTSVMVHLLVPGIARALSSTRAPRILVLNASPEGGETEGFGADTYLRTWRELFPEQRLDVVLADPSCVTDRGALIEAARSLGSRVHLADVLERPGGPHDPGALGSALESVLRTVPARRESRGPVQG
ncbi:MAG: uridine diphosphate-N-acetylglucosamine-binding protein YvcK [bacterium]